jgi:hypothetical protein
MRSSLFVAFLALGLSSCGLVAEYRAQQQAQINAADDAQCQSYGVAPGSDAYVACRMNLTNNRAQADAVSRSNDAALSGALLSR